MVPNPPQVAKATLTPVLANGNALGQPVTVHFNPASLIYSIENAVAQQSPKKVQYAGQFTGKLTMDLQFDTTDTGADVRTVTNQVAMFMQPAGNASAAAQTSAPPNSNGNAPGPPPTAPPLICFQWGTYQFTGVMDSFKETIDFFSNDGVALRALVSIQLSRQDNVFDEGADLSPTTTSGSLVPSSTSDSALSMATRGGDPSAMRQLGAQNGLESLRFTAGAAMQVGGGSSVQLNPPTAFVSSTSASAGLSLSGSTGISVGASAGISIGGSTSLSAGATSGMAPAFGASASAGVPATAGALAGLQVGVATRSSTANLNPLQMLPATSSAAVATFSGASFSLGGAANNSGSAGLSTNVGTPSSLAQRLTFSSDD